MNAFARFAPALQFQPRLRGHLEEPQCSLLFGVVDDLVALERLIRSRGTLSSNLNDLLEEGLLRRNVVASKPTQSNYSLRERKRDCKDSDGPEELSAANLDYEFEYIVSLHAFACFPTSQSILSQVEPGSQDCLIPASTSLPTFLGMVSDAQSLNISALSDSFIFAISMSWFLSTHSGILSAPPQGLSFPWRLANSPLP